MDLIDAVGAAVRGMEYRYGVAAGVMWAARRVLELHEQGHSVAEVVKALMARAALEVPEILGTLGQARVEVRRPPWEEP